MTSYNGKNINAPKNILSTIGPNHDLDINSNLDLLALEFGKIIYMLSPPPEYFSPQWDLSFSFCLILRFSKLLTGSTRFIYIFIYLLFLHDFSALFSLSFWLHDLVLTQMICLLPLFES